LLALAALKQTTLVADASKPDVGSHAQQADAAPSSKGGKAGKSDEEHLVVAMKTWYGLKDQMAKLGDEVKEILLVRKDMSDLQQDLKSQENLWRGAEEDLSKENVALGRRVESLRQEVQRGNSIDEDVRNLERKIEEAKNAGKLAREKFETDEKQMKIKMAYFQERDEQLLQELKSVDQLARSELDKARERQVQLDESGQSLRLRVAELQDQLKDGEQQLPMLQPQDDAKARELNRQLAEMKAGFKRMKSQMKPKLEVEQDMARLEVNRKEATMEVIKVTEDQVTLAAQCEHDMNRRREVLYAEESKAQARHQEMLQLCGTAKQKNAVLKQMAVACEARFTAPPATSP